MSATFGPIGFELPKFLAALREREVDCALITTPESVFYTTGYTVLPSSHNPILYSLRNQFPWVVWITRDGERRLVCWAFSTSEVNFGVDAVVGYDTFSQAVDAIRTLLKDAVATKARLAAESQCPMWIMRLYEEAGGDASRVTWIDDTLLKLRLIKSEEEIRRVERAVAISEQTLEELYSVVHVGMSRLDLIREAKVRAIVHGATAISHVTTSFGRENPEIGIAEFLETNRLVTLDVGAIYDGYFSDNRRYAFTGSVPDALVERYQTMCQIVDAVGEAMKPGVTYQSLTELAYALHRQHGLSPAFTHIGHHMGLATEEEWIDNTTQGVIRPGMTINLEMYVPAREYGGTIGTEESYVIEPDGSRQISHMARQIREVR